MAMPAPNPSALTLVVVLSLVAWRVYARFRKLVGRQRLSRVRPWITLTVFPLILLLLGALSFRHPESLLWLAGGLALGVPLGQYGLRKTQFEPTPQGLYYTPNAHLGIALTLLFVGRIIYRIVEIYVLGGPNSVQDFGRSVLTLSIFGLLAGYYMTYAVGLIRWRRSVQKT